MLLKTTRNGQKMSRDDMIRFTRKKEKIVEDLKKLRAKLQKELIENEEWDYELDKKKSAAREMAKEVSNYRKSHHGELNENLEHSLQHSMDETMKEIESRKSKAGSKNS
jgi:hypothetical protein